MALPASPVQEQLQPEMQLRNQIAAAVRSINWSYALFWSISSTQPGFLTWTDGFYNGEVKTRKIANSAELTADQLVMQRSEQLRELYEALLSGECGRRAARPVASLSPEDLGDTEWYYVVCMTYAFRPGQGLPGRSFASNERVWMCNAQLPNSKAFPRALLAKVAEDPDLVSRATTSFWETQFPACSEKPISSTSPSANETVDIIMFEDLDHIAMEATIAGGHELGEAERLSDPATLDLERINKETDELFYSLCEDTWFTDGSFGLPASPQLAPGAATNDGSRATTCFRAWARPVSESNEATTTTVPAVVQEPQKLLKKAVAGGAWAASNGGGGTARTTAEESGIKNRVVSERKRREKLNEMLLVLKSLVPSIHDKVDKASILAQTIAYLKELQRRVQELESSKELVISPPSETRRRHDDDDAVRMKASAAGSKRNEPPWALSKDDDTSNVTVTVSDKEVLVEVQCRWEELLMMRVFDAIKSLQLDVLSIQASAPDGFMGLKIRAQFAGSASVVPWMISEALRKAIGKR